MPEMKGIQRVRTILTRAAACVTAACLLAAALQSGAVTAAAAERFSDVPAGHWADSAVHALRELGVTDGIGGNRFGLGMTIKRDEFVAFLARLMGWQPAAPAAGSFADNQDAGKWYYGYVETAVARGLVEAGGTFRPEEPIRRGEMASMIVGALGYETLAESVASQGSGFTDVTENAGQIAVAASLGIVNGMDASHFAPDATATREQAAAMMVRMRDGLTRAPGTLHAFYAISSYPQIGLMQNLDAVSFGWSRLDAAEADGEPYLNLDKAGSNEYGIPTGYGEAYGTAKSAGMPAYLMVAGQNTAVIEAMLADGEDRTRIVSEIASAVAGVEREDGTLSFDGAVVDLEGLKGETSKTQFTAFVQALGKSLHAQSKKLLVAVPPARRAGLSYYDGYDFRAIGEAADTVILMAHDYDATSMTAAEMASGWTVTPLTPFDDVWYALKAITDARTGVADKSKVLLQISFDSTVWTLKNGVVTESRPDHLSMDAVVEKLQAGATIKYSELNRNPVATWLENAQGELVKAAEAPSDAVTRVMWYEDARSVADKIDLAARFGIGGISLWRLGTIPDTADATAGASIHMDVWRTVLEKMGVE